MSLSNYLLNSVSLQTYTKEHNRKQLYQALLDNDIEGFKAIFGAFFASIPHDWYRKNSIADYEGFYASVFYSYFSALGLEVRVEETTNHGQLDMVVLFEDCCYIFEFKVIEQLKDENSALQQIKEHNYAEKFKADYQNIYLIGVEFSRKERNITKLDWEQG
jgi:hypothetical protein